MVIYIVGFGLYEHRLLKEDIGERGILMLCIGLDIGSTTIKCVVLDNNKTLVYSEYRRHFSKIRENAVNFLHEIQAEFPNEKNMSIAISGSAGMGVANELDLPFVQEVYATRIATKTYMPNADVVIELGGEDAKILFVSGLPEVRMNGSCAGGTGAFIDQMATLLNVTPSDMNEMAKDYTKIYSIASRCGVFAKSDIQPLLNQGAKKEDISQSIFYAVVNQTVAGLAQGRDIKGNVVYLGGPLTYISCLREAFDKTLKLEGLCPENSLYYVALGAALMCEEEKNFSLIDLISKIEKNSGTAQYSSCNPLFKDEEDFNKFSKRHKIEDGIKLSPLSESKISYIGIDAGSTTLKAVLVNEDEEIVLYKYMENKGNPVNLVKEFLEEVYKTYPDIIIKSVVTTGYGEEIIKNAFHGDMGIVETVAHFTAAKKFLPEVDFIIDIGGQDIKCFKIRNGAIDNIFLNEACSSGCGSFLQTFAAALGEGIAQFASRGIFAEKPVDLGTRCTVFMNSSVKQAQKDGASVENISAGLSISVVKNALYKVIRAGSADDLGQNIVVQGGTFLNDAVLRAFEQEIGRDVVRPNISGLMGAYGAALYGKKNFKGEKSSVLNAERLTTFKHEVIATTCKMCQNNCKLTVNIFDDGRRFIGGNRCENPLHIKSTQKVYNLYDYKKSLLEKYSSFKTEKETIGIPMVLNMFELLPFWHTFFKNLGFGIEVSPESTRKMYLKGQHTIPSDTVCYPAKLIHGHVETLMEKKVDALFYPCMTFNFDEGLGDNHYNCPVVAYYPEVIGANIDALKEIKYISDYVGIHRRKDFPKKMTEVLQKYFKDIKLNEVKIACDKAYEEHFKYLDNIKVEGQKYLKEALENDRQVIILAGRPYHLDGEVNHGIDKLICDCGAAVISEDALTGLVEKFPTDVLNQWTYHSRLYAAAKYVANANNPKLNLVQMVSFGCGVDAICTDETRAILEKENKIYTQIKIDEITNLGAVKIRLRSLFSAVEGSV